MIVNLKIGDQNKMDIKTCLSKANQELFIDSHRKIIKNKSKKGLILIVNGGNIKLYHDDQIVNEIEDYRSDIFHQLKEISHLYVSFYLLQISPNEDKLKKLHGCILSLLSNLDQLRPYLIHEKLSSEEIEGLLKKIEEFLKILGDNDNFQELNDKVNLI